jgi:hypothetical protein
MFTARCVPNMYLFGTFSAQNPTRNRLTVAAFAGPDSVPGRSGRAAPPASRTGRSGKAGCGNTATLPPATPLRARFAPRKAFRAAQPPKQFGLD